MKKTMAIALTALFSMSAFATNIPINLHSINKSTKSKDCSNLPVDFIMVFANGLSGSTVMGLNYTLSANINGQTQQVTTVYNGVLSYGDGYGVVSNAACLKENGVKSFNYSLSKVSATNIGSPGFIQKATSGCSVSVNDIKSNVTVISVLSSWDGNYVYCR